MKVTISLIGSYQKDLASWLVMENLIHWKGKVFLLCFHVHC